MWQPRRILSRAITFVPGLMLTPLLAFGQEPLQLNVPYRCQDGVTRTVNRCDKNPRGVEVCFWREEENGQASERYNVRGQMDGWLRMCTAQPPNAARPRGLRLPQRHRRRARNCLNHRRQPLQRRSRFATIQGRWLSDGVSSLAAASWSASARA